MKRQKVNYKMELDQQMKQKEVLQNIDLMKKKQEQAMMAENALYAKAMAEQAKQQNKHIKQYLGNHYDL